MTEQELLEAQPTTVPTDTRAIEDGITRRNVARIAYRAKIKSLLDESSDERLADIWQRAYSFSVELPDRREIIEDLADLAEALRPSPDAMEAGRLCRLIETYQLPSRVPWVNGNSIYTNPSGRQRAAARRRSATL